MGKKRKKAELKLAREQRYTALTKAFETIEVFAHPSCSPDQMEGYEAFRDYLLTMYDPKKKRPKPPKCPDLDCKVPPCEPAPAYYSTSAHQLVCTPYSVENLHKMAKDLKLSRRNFDRDKHGAQYIIPRRRYKEISAKTLETTPNVVRAIKKGFVVTLNFMPEQSLFDSKQPTIWREISINSSACLAGRNEITIGPYNP